MRVPSYEWGAEVREECLQRKDLGLNRLYSARGAQLPKIE